VSKKQCLVAKRHITWNSQEIWTRNWAGRSSLVVERQEMVIEIAK